MNQKTVLILVNKYTTIIKFRMELVEALVSAGYKVFVSVPGHENVREIEDSGANIIETAFDKNGINPIKDIFLMFSYRKIIKEIKADVVLTYTIKPNIYGGMAASSLKIPYIANITGLGTALAKKGILQNISVLLYRFGFARITKIFFQNTSDLQFFQKKRIALGKYELIPGSGVNLDKFKLLVYPDDKVVRFAFISRIMKEKGIEQYLEIARRIKQEYENVEFHVAGFGDEQYEKKMMQLHDEGLIKYHGLLSDVRGLLKDIHCVIHPTFYPEGMSNVLLESAASGRPIISTNRPGCKEAIEHEKNGYLVNEQDIDDLEEKVRLFLALEYNKKCKMGIEGRKKIEREFDRSIIVQRYLAQVKEVFV